MVSAGDLGRILYDCVARSWSGSLCCRWRRRALWKRAQRLRVLSSPLPPLKPPTLNFAAMYLSDWQCPPMHWCRLVQIASLA